MIHNHFFLTFTRMACFLSCLACLMPSCNSDTPDDVFPSRGAEMSFNVSDLSRASVTSSIDKFAIYGDMKIGNGNASLPNVVFRNAEVVYSDGDWRYEGTQYWFPKYEHSFVAISPVSVLATDPVPEYSYSKLSFTYEIPAPGGILSSNDDVTDILISTHRRYYESEESTDNKITFTFGHVLSLINIAPAFYDNTLDSHAYIEFHRLEFSGVGTKARFDIEPASILSNNQTDDRTVDITGQEDGNLTIELTTPVQVYNTAETVRLFPDNDAIIMLPKDFTGDTDAHITVFYTINGDDTINQVVLPLNNLKWESGNSYTYKFKIERTGLIVGDWEINSWNEVKGESTAVS